MKLVVLNGEIIDQKGAKPGDELKFLSDLLFDHFNELV